MKCRLTFFLTAVCLLAAPLCVQAQTAKEKPKEDPAHEELRALYREMVDAFNKGDYEKLYSYLDEDVVVTWQNAEVSHKPAGVRAYFDKMMKGPEKRVERITIDPTVDELTHLYGNTGVAFGSSKDRYQLTDGMDFVLPTRWTAAVVKKDGKWKLTAFHASTNMFDNPVLAYFKRMAWWVGGIALAVGVVVSTLACWIFGRLRKKS